MNIPQRIVIVIAGLAIGAAFVAVPWHSPESHELMTFESGNSVSIGGWAYTTYAPFFESPLTGAYIDWQSVGVEVLIICIVSSALYCAVSPSRTTPPSHHSA